MTERFKETAFMVGFLLYLLVLYLDSAKLSPGSRAFPMAVMGASLIAVALKLLTLRFNSLKWLDPSGNVADEIIEKAGKDSAPACGGTPEKEVTTPESPLLFIALFMVWLITFAVAIYFIGFLPTSALWLFIFLFGLSRIKLAKALVLSVCTFGVLYVIFVMALGTRFPPGILF